MNKVMNGLISKSQLFNCIGIFNEGVDYSKRFSKCLILKLDFEKSNDKVSWEYLKFLLKRMGFGNSWILWMEALVFSSSMLVSVNGSSTKDVDVERGIAPRRFVNSFLVSLGN